MIRDKSLNIHIAFINCDRNSSAYLTSRVLKVLKVSVNKQKVESKEKLMYFSISINSEGKMSSFLDLVHLDFTKFIGTRIGNVTLLRELGRGNKGVVFTGFQESLKRNVAVKMLPKATVRSNRDKSMFELEAQIVAGLSHPNIIPIHEIGEEEEFYYQVMPLIEGDDLDGLTKKRFKHPVPAKRGLTLNESFNLIIQVLDALEYAHQDGVVHRDIKPANILLEGRTKRPYVADFGIAQTAQHEADHFKGLVVGSPVYLAPEQAKGGTVDGRADIYAAGMTLIKMLVGEVPRRKESSEQIIRRKITDPASFMPFPMSRFSKKFDEELDAIISKATAVNIEERFKTGTEFVKALEIYRRQHIDRFSD